MKERRPSQGEMLEFILKHRRGDAFKDYSALEIFETLRFCAAVDGLACVTKPDGAIAGVVTAIPNHGEKQLRITNILCTEPIALVALIQTFYSSYPDYTLTAKRHGKECIYNDTNKLCFKLCNHAMTHHGQLALN